MPKKISQPNIESGGVAVIDKPAPKALKRVIKRGRPQRVTQKIEPITPEPEQAIPEPEQTVIEPALKSGQESDIPVLDKVFMDIPKNEMRTAPPMSEEDVKGIVKEARIRQIRNDLKKRALAPKPDRPRPESSAVGLDNPVLEKEKVNNESNVIVRKISDISRKIGEFFLKFSYRPRTPKRPDLN